MSEAEILTLAHPQVQAAKEKFEKWQKGRKLSLSFEELFHYFQLDCQRISPLAKHCGVCRQRMSQIYNDYFRDLFGKKSGRERVRSCSVAKALVRTKKGERYLLAQEELAAIVEKIRAFGYTVSGIPTGKGRKLCGVDRRTILINGHRCSLHYVRNIHTLQGEKRSRSHVSVSYSKLCEVSFLIIKAAPPGFPERMFVLPSALLRQVVFSNSPRRKKPCKSIYLPLERLPIYNNILPEIDYWEYEDAWHLLATEKAQPVSP